MEAASLNEVRQQLPRAKTQSTGTDVSVWMLMRVHLTDFKPLDRTRACHLCERTADADAAKSQCRNLIQERVSTSHQIKFAHLEHVAKSLQISGRRDVKGLVVQREVAVLSLSSTPTTRDK